LLFLRIPRAPDRLFGTLLSSMKNKAMNEADFLALLEKVLPKTTQDPHLATAIYAEVVKEVRLVKSLQSFEKFCETGGLPDLAPETVAGFERELIAQFGAESIEITQDESGKSVDVAIELPDRVVSSRVKVDPTVTQEQPVPAPFVPFPVSLPEDPELVWILGRREDFGPDEASRALLKIEEEFWQTKKGIQLQKGGADKTFAEFIEHVPAAALTDSGLKRHYKGPETLHTIRQLQRRSEDTLGALLEE
jgi:hypothetical protein